VTAKKATLGEICRFVGGGTPSRKQPDFYTGSIPWVTVKDFKTLRLSDAEEHITEAAVQESATNIVAAGTVLLVTRVGLGKVAIADQPLAINQDIKGLIPSAEVLPEYLFWFLLSQAHVIERLGTGATVKGVTLQDVKAIEILVPTHAEQRRTVDLLSRAEGILRLRREAQAKAQAILPALFLDLFGDPATNPKGWPVVPLGELASVQGGLQVTRARETLPIERPYLRVANVYRGSLDLDEIKMMRMTEAESLRTALEPGDLLLVEGHGNPQEVGRVAVWDGEIAGCTHQNHLIRARPDSTRILPAYACALLNSTGGRQALVRSGKTTSGLSTISTRNVKEAPIMLPPLNAQQRFEQQGRAVQSILAQQAAALHKAQATFDALLARSFGAARL